MRKKMIKGVSKQILEVTNTDNPYFEKIIFFAHPLGVSTALRRLFGFVSFFTHAKTVLAIFFIL